MEETADSYKLIKVGQTFPDFDSLNQTWTNYKRVYQQTYNIRGSLLLKGKLENENSDCKYLYVRYECNSAKPTKESRGKGKRET